ncbi:MGMT family protein [Coprothermobacteraceae bacterium]|nr:MGMT family protein [Coprothermobacteraceae bacterium]
MRYISKSESIFAYRLPFGFWLQIELTEEGLVHETLIFEEASRVSLPLLEPGPAKDVLDLYSRGIWDPVKVWAVIDKRGIAEPRLVVYKALVETKLGETISYKELGSKANAHARAVGTYMRTNRLPIFVPCHRVVGSHGLGGFTPSTDWKIRILSWERGAWTEL